MINITKLMLQLYLIAIKKVCQFAVAHMETILELANTIRPSTIPIAFIIRSADNIVNILLKKDTDLKFLTSILTQAYILLDAAMSCKSFEGKVRITE